MFENRELTQKQEDLLIPIINLNPKLVLGGSLALYLMGIMDLDKRRLINADLDFSLKEPITRDELSHLVDFIDFEITNPRNSQYRLLLDNEKIDNYWEINSPTPKPTPEQILKENLIQLQSKSDGPLEFPNKIDIFNQKVISSGDIIKFRYKDYDLWLTHPSIIWMNKMKYALDPRCGAQRKHLMDYENLDMRRYFQITKYHIKNVITHYPGAVQYLYNVFIVNARKKIEDENIPPF